MKANSPKLAANLLEDELRCRQKWKIPDFFPVIDIFDPENGLHMTPCTAIESWVAVLW
jgi:hypothetical protein